MKLEPYPDYKKYEEVWIGDVPEHWEIVPLKHIADFINGAPFKPTEWCDAGVPIIRIENLNGSEDFNYFQGNLDDRYLVHDGDLLFGWSGNRGTPSFGPYIWRYKGVCALNQHIFRVIPIEIDVKFLYWALKAVTVRVEDKAHGIIGMVHITKGDLGAISIPIPPSDEAKAIFRFLDAETAKIDALISEQQDLIALLREKRQSVISEALTKGVNSNVFMKNSGVEWLGEVPKHWTSTRVRVLFRQEKRQDQPGKRVLSVYRDYGVILRILAMTTIIKPLKT